MNRCFACGPDNPDGMQLKFTYDPATRLAECRVAIDPKYQGASGFLHGGVIATLLDEAMAKANGLAGIKAVTVRLTVTYRKMAPVGRELRVTGRRIRQRGRRLYLRSAIHDSDGQLLAEARGLFLQVNHRSGL